MEIKNMTKDATESFERRVAAYNIQSNEIIYQNLIID